MARGYSSIPFTKHAILIPPLALRALYEFLFALAHANVLLACGAYILQGATIYADKLPILIMKAESIGSGLRFVAARFVPNPWTLMLTLRILSE